ncbi:cytochrome P450 monooxygenase [Pseudovirgaria hyperparasitica]|uniref:Cytochrome P450 monooxygenase n=1 Tax=Pseudovirgaria hyperparasitica TaxID=470096 RepID=A0A6A6W3I0_9PEZI|nr:cytochrome P450 monooxygenase [Pseudovirgaria hyperparasitica]KAF2756147.1 cytochrome P450 monooxygenase [Pseudovirgaria hyperparasitica]
MSLAMEAYYNMMFLLVDPTFLILSLALFCYPFIISKSKYSHLKDVSLVNPAKPFFVSTEKARRRFMRSSLEIVAEARNLYPYKPFRMYTDWGEILVLPSTFADEIRNDPRLSLTKALKQDHHASLPGFEVVNCIGRDDEFVQSVVRKWLTQHLCVVIVPVSEETAYALDINFGPSTEWHETNLKAAVFDIIARMSSRIFLGSQLCRNEEWLEITKSYTAIFYTGSSQLRLFPRVLRPIVHWFLPSCRRLREQQRKARHVIRPLVEARQKAKEEARAKGQPDPKFEDALEWASEQRAATGSECDDGVFQLTLSLLAIHNSFDLVQQTMLDLAQHPEFIPSIRDELITVLRTHGWNKASLFHMKRLDSAIKESQRRKPSSILTLRRYATDDVTLSNGLLIKKGSRLNVDSIRMMDEELYPEPEKYDAMRFYNLRQQPGCEATAQLVSTSADHLSFGLGRHECPGKVFAANAIKIVLCHIIAKYEWKLAEDTTIVPDTKGMTNKASPWTQIMVRKRAGVDIELDGLL